MKNNKNQTNRIQTVNVILLEENAIYKIYSYKDNYEGNKEAEKKFRDLIEEKQKNIDKDEIEDALDDGYFKGSDFEVDIIHSCAE